MSSKIFVHADLDSLLNNLNLISVTLFLFVAIAFADVPAPSGFSSSCGDSQESVGDLHPRSCTGVAVFP
jgi:hypothetical protein